MGDIIQVFQVRRGPPGPARWLRMYFDSGSRFTFVKESATRRLGGGIPLSRGRPFGGLGNGRFEAKAVLDAEICFAGIWCPCLAYVVPDEVLEPEYDVLVGHELMQALNIRLRPRERRVELDRASLRLSLCVRRTSE
ncbi:MAG: hypothetical protein HYY93_04735 [Planctomycetes bacterium]|nr:hypothetical protein [Planctomycetota bacterium]